MQTTTLEISDVKQHLDEWRNSREKRSAIPAHLWSEVLNLVGRYSSSILSRVLGISSQQIKHYIFA